MVFAYWSKEMTSIFGAKTIVLSWYWVLFPAAAVWTPLCVAAQSTSFLLLSMFRLHGCYFSRWDSPVNGYWFQKDQPSRLTMVTKRGRDAIRNPNILFQIDKGEAHPKKHVWFEKNRNFLLYQHISDFLLSSSLHRTSAVAVQSLDLGGPLVGLVHVRRSTAANVCLWVKRPNHRFSREKGKVAFPK